MSVPRQICVAAAILFLFCIIYISFTINQNVTDIKEIPNNQLIDVPNTLDPKTIAVWNHDLTGMWKRRTDVCTSENLGTVTALFTPFGPVPIHVHDPQKDIWVSRRIINTGSFDLDKIKIISKFLESDETLNFIDIGANLGVYSLSFAQMGRKVIAVDALNLNIEKLCASLNSSHFQDRLFLVMNAISSQHEIVSLAADEKNFGGTFIDQNADFIKHVKGQTVSGRHYNNVSTIVFDDLLTLPFISLFPRVFIKMDIEGFEHKALERAYQFFKQIFVQGIQIEWIFHRNKPSGQIIVNFLEQHSFVPYNPSNLRPLRKSSMGNWATQDVLWLHH